MNGETRFIGKLVDELYAILIGIGFYDVVKHIRDLLRNEKEPLSITDPKILFLIFTAIFLIIVICYYWWDWSENIAKNIKSTYFEFIIDMSILLTLEMLFLNFDDPKRLVTLFALLSFLNLLWVINYLKDKHPKNDIYSSKLVQCKFLWLLFYVTIFVACNIEMAEAILAHLQLQEELCFILIVVVFYCERKFCFKYRLRS